MYGFFVYFVPLFTIIYAYFFIVQAVFDHEQQMREQAKKMNVASLRSGEAQSQSAEFKLAKVWIFFRNNNCGFLSITLWAMQISKRYAE